MKNTHMVGSAIKMASERGDAKQLLNILKSMCSVVNISTCPKGPDHIRQSAEKALSR